MIATDFKPGDVLRYMPKDRHCHEGMAIVQDDGRVLDTFWTYQPGGLSADERATAEVWFNLADYEEVRHEEMWRKYAPSDRAYVTHQHGLECDFYIRRGAEPSLETQIKNAQEAIEAAESELRSAEWRLQCRREDLATLEAQRVPSPRERSSEEVER